MEIKMGLSSRSFTDVIFHITLYDCILKVFFTKIKKGLFGLAWKRCGKLFAARFILGHCYT